MKWIRFTLETHTDAVDILSYMLDEIGVEGIEIEDHIPLTEEEKRQMYVDILPDPEENDGSAKVHFLYGTGKVQSGYGHYAGAEYFPRDQKLHEHWKRDSQFVGNGGQGLGQ